MIGIVAKPEIVSEVTASIEAHAFEKGRIPWDAIETLLIDEVDAFLIAEAIRKNVKIALYGHFSPQDKAEFFSLGGSDIYEEVDQIEEGEDVLDAIQNKSFFKRENDIKVEWENRIYAVYSPKGGAGKTTSSVNLAVGIATANPNIMVALVDFDLEFGDVASTLGIKPTKTILDWVDSNYDEQIKNYVIDYLPNLHVIPAPKGVGDHIAINGTVSTQILDMLSRRYDRVIIDCDHNESDPVVVSLLNATKILIPVYYSRPAVDELDKAKIFFNSIGIPSEKVYCFLSRVNPKVTQYVEIVEKKLRDYGWNVLPAVHEEPFFEEAVFNRQIPITTPKTEGYRKEFGKIISLIEGNLIEMKVEKKSFLKKLIGG